MLDKICSLRGVHAGAVGSYEGQALVIVNSGGATAADVQKFATDITHNVLEKTDITIEWEVTKI